MSPYDDLLAVVKYVRDRTGDPNAWQSGLTPSEVSAVVTPTTRLEQLDAILCKVRQQHSDLFAPTVAMPGDLGLWLRGSGVPAAAEPQQGDAAETIGYAEAALAHQNSASSQLDLQVISAILNAHLKTVEGREALNKLQQETEGAVRTRSDLDTPAGARDFQRFLITKLRDIRAVVANASLDDTSKSALMAAWTSLYGASKTGLDVPSGQRPASAALIGASAPGASQQVAELPDAEDPYLDSLLLDDPRPTAGPTAPPMPMTPMMPSIPNLGVVPTPGGLTAPGSIPGWNAPGGLPLSRLLDGIGTEPEPRDFDKEQLASADPNLKDQEPDHHNDDGEKESSAEKPESPPTGPTTVTLPDGETVTAASPQLAAAIKAAVGGASIADAFREQGITIPAPGTTVTNPIDPSRVTPGDVGIFTDRHALALGRSQALLDGQIQHISAVTGPSFLGWEHPPTQTGTPTPTWPAATATGSQ
ncbi:DUF4226 domain-containing protein [Mycobacterium haemophilum]|uniref:DUF4226 domain-containing protein n=1 Tax=Mycobacterium haemophilum TaxID=29311 RepID=A0A0I9U319_9MYCO|nr:DUF4226 domain-containing protein [Mycobacterium haemophilum]KLO28662.1 hypothetical protein ABH39_13840 [Mycobacterium haemophilum]KLO35488.1 hypothetical protein ABH38_15465 [Mycobacterium haemophilum]KLO40723.1 hypothetical protein ABH37_15195 [Mycobacterium haemophilum]KLO48161.1 hypothetical protein ABH36_14785 [Mycobacterium haemophilum]